MIFVAIITPTMLFSAEACCCRRLELHLLECGPMPNVMVALSNIGGALCATPQSLADARRPLLDAVQ